MMTVSHMDRHESQSLVDIPEDGWLRLVVIGEEGEPLDLAPYAASLLELGATTPDAYCTTSEAVEPVEPVERALDEGDGLVDFATLEASEGVRFWRNGVELPADDALAILSSRIVLALRESLSPYNH